MTARIANVTIHAEDPAALSRFWAAVMGYPEPDGYPPELEAQLRAAGMTDDVAADIVRAGGPAELADEDTDWIEATANDEKPDS